MQPGRWTRNAAVSFTGQSNDLTANHKRSNQLLFFQTHTEAKFMNHTSKLMRTLLLLGVLTLALALAACGAPAAEAPAADAPAAEAPAAEAPAEGDAAAAAEPAGDGMYNEAPMLAEQVAAGELPPVDERLPAEPLVQDVVDQIGVYGGTPRRAVLGPSDHNNYPRVVYDALERHAPDGSEFIPHVAKGWESNEDFTHDQCVSEEVP